MSHELSQIHRSTPDHSRHPGCATTDTDRRLYSAFRPTQHARDPGWHPDAHRNLHPRDQHGTPGEPSQKKSGPAFVTDFSAEALERAASQEPVKRETADTLSQEEHAEVRKLQQRDQEVRRHEQAHKAAAGKLASGAPSFSYTRGPDGKQYISGGEVQIDVSAVAGDPQATIQKMRQVQSAARAPASPSGADLKVAAAAAKQEATARAELRKENAAESNDQAQEDGSGSTLEASSSFSARDESSESATIHRRHSRHLPAAYRQQSERRSSDQLNLLAELARLSNPPSMVIT
ncbi:MAG TPA: hypothetical protein EYQ60_12485 [Myxococcales bacterium]|nr:hypothetical protein [Myxococcales bacterium]HIK83919.1 hypothetical protein [Myxococcales bacterium]